VFPFLSLDGWGYDSELIHVALLQQLQVSEIDLRLVHDYRNSHFRPLIDGCATLSELFEIRWNDLRGVYGGRAFRSVFSKDAALPGLDFLKETAQPKNLEVPSDTPRDDVAA
jgi:hypothetical protein